MGNEESTCNDGTKESTRHAVNYNYKTMHLVINKECEHIRAVCEKNKVLKTIQKKLTLFEHMTFNNIKHSKCCGHYDIGKSKNATTKLTPDCTEEAPHSFPTSDVFLCSNHCNDTSKYFNKLMVQCNLEEQVRKINKTSGQIARKLLNPAYDALKQIQTAFHDASINKVSPLPFRYWPLLVTKLLIAVKKMRKDQTATTAKSIRLVDHLLQLLILWICHESNRCRDNCFYFDYYHESNDCDASSACFCTGIG
eukprot:524688_1